MSDEGSCCRALPDSRSNLSNDNELGVSRVPRTPEAKRSRTSTPSVSQPELPDNCASAASSCRDPNTEAAPEAATEHFQMPEAATAIPEEERPTKSGKGTNRHKRTASLVSSDDEIPVATAVPTPTAERIPPTPTEVPSEDGQVPPPAPSPKPAPNPINAPPEPPNNTTQAANALLRLCQPC